MFTCKLVTCNVQRGEPGTGSIIRSLRVRKSVCYKEPSIDDDEQEQVRLLI